LQGLVPTDLVENRECPENCVNVRDTLKMGGKPLTKFDSKPSTWRQGQPS